MIGSADLAHRLGGILPEGIRPVARRQLVRFRHLGLTSSDVVLVSYPKSGSTWLRFLLGCTLGGREVDFDSVRDALPPVGRHRHAPALLPNGGRFLRSHEPLHVLTGRRPERLLYLVRDGRDVAVSYLHHVRRVGRFSADMTAFLPHFLAGEVDSYGPWHAHVLEAAQPLGDNRRPCLIVRYEDLRHNTLAELARIHSFIGVDVATGQLEEAIVANTKQQMHAKERSSRLLTRQNADGSTFVRPDNADTWRELFSAEMARDFERIAGEALRAFGYLA
jgi:hypothetical protein